jgi:hypothetical protein
MRKQIVEVLMLTNMALIPGHIWIERVSGDINWLQLGDQSHVSAGYVGLESAAAMTLVLAVFDHFYPDMREMFKARLTHYAAVLIFVESAIWLFYK